MDKPPCQQEEQMYIDCLQRYSSFNSGICRGELFYLKYCTQFEGWMEHTIKSKIEAKEKQAKVETTKK